MIGLFFSGLFGGALGILKRVLGLLASVNWAKVWPYIAAAGCILFAFLWLNARSDERHENKLRVAAEASAVHWQAQDKVDVAAHLVTKASLTAALGEINAANARSEAAHKMLLDQEAYWQSKDAENVARFKDTAATVAQLEKGAAGKRDVPCKLSPGAVKALDGL